MNTVDTIAALCTAPGGAISIIRISGKDALMIAESVWKSDRTLAERIPRTLNLGYCISESADKTDRGDSALAVYMPSPKTYTGEDVVEIHCHGGALVSKEVLDLVLSRGARAAEPGEFTYRAFINGKLDLTQAEAVGDIVAAHSSMALHIAERQMSGVLGEKISSIRNTLLTVLSECESHLDFGEEDLDWESPNQLKKKLDDALKLSRELYQSGREGIVLRNGVRIVIAGRPNAGKSSLLNLLLGVNRAIVTQIPGTTRDTLEEFANIRNIPVRLIDTAGIREADDIIEGIGVQKSFESMKLAQIIIWMMDASGNIQEEYDTLLEHTAENSNVIAFWNKRDIAGDYDLPVFKKKSGIITVKGSVLKNEGIDDLFDAVETLVWGERHTVEPEVAVSARHTELLRTAIDVQQEIPVHIEDEEWEIAAMQLRTAIAALGTITGEDADPDVLDDIFARFCIGK